MSKVDITEATHQYKEAIEEIINDLSKKYANTPEFFTFSNGFNAGVEAATIILLEYSMTSAVQYNSIPDEDLNVRIDFLQKSLTDLEKETKALHLGSHLHRGAPAQCNALDDLNKEAERAILANYLRKALQRCESNTESPQSPSATQGNTEKNCRNPVKNHPKTDT